MVGTTAILGMLLAIIWLFVVRKFARALIYISLAFSVAILIAEALYFLSMHGKNYGVLIPAKTIFSYCAFNNTLFSGRRCLLVLFPLQA